MAEKQFSWITEATLESIDCVPEQNKEQVFLEKLKAKLITHKRVLIFLTSLLAVLFVLKVTQDKPVGITTPHIEGMIAVLPVPKGQIVEGMLLKPVRVSPSQLSKSQKLLLLRPDDAEKIMGKVRAKKDIPSQKPIFWNELELVPETKNASKALVPVVTYPED